MSEGPPPIGEVLALLAGLDWDRPEEIAAACERGWHWIDLVGWDSDLPQRIAHANHEDRKLMQSVLWGIRNLAREVARRREPSPPAEVTP